MRAVLGVVSLLIVLAIVGSLVRKQGSAMGVAGMTSAAVDASGPATVQQQSKAIQDKIRDDTVRALEQSADRTQRAADSN